MYNYYTSSLDCLYNSDIGSIFYEVCDQQYTQYTTALCTKYLFVLWQ